MPEHFRVQAVVHVLQQDEAGVGIQAIGYAGDLVFGVADEEAKDFGGGEGGAADIEDGSVAVGL